MTTHSSKEENKEEFIKLLQDYEEAFPDKRYMVTILIRRIENE